MRGHGYRYLLRPAVDHHPCPTANDRAIFEVPVGRGNEPDGPPPRHQERLSDLDSTVSVHPRWETNEHRQRMMAARATEVVEIETDHSPFLTRPGELADLLARCA